MTATQLKSAPSPPKDSDFGHYCRVHRHDISCDANPTQCQSFCGLHLTGAPVAEGETVCVVCHHMCAAKGWL